MKSSVQPRYAWLVMAILWAMDAFAMAVFFSVGLLIPIWETELGMTRFEGGVVAAAGFLGFGAMALPASIWITRYNPRRVVTVCVFIMALLAILQSQAPNTTVLVLGRLGFVALQACRAQMQILFIQQWINPRHYALVNSMDFGIRFFAMAVASIATPALLIYLDGWRNYYWAIGIGLLVVFLAWVLLGRENRRVTEKKLVEREKNPANVLRQRKVLWIIAGTQMGAATAFGAFTAFFPLYAMDRLGLSLGVVGAIMALFPFGAALGAFAVGPLSQYTGRRKPYIWAPGILLVILYLGVLYSDTGWLASIFMFASGAVGLSVGPIIATVTFDMGMKPREIAVAQGLVRTLYPGAAMMGPLLVGIFAEQTGSLFLGLLVVCPMPLTLVLGGLLIPETGSKSRSIAGPDISVP